MLIKDSTFNAHKGGGTCPLCWGKIRYYATLDGLMQWKIMERCQCKHINNKVNWPFDEEPTFEAVKPAEFYQHGVYLTTEEGQYEEPNDLLRMEELYAEEAERFLHDVDHGWEENYH